MKIVKNSEKIVKNHNKVMKLSYIERKISMKEKKPLLYKIYYGDNLVYLGRTKQPLQNRLRGHFFKKPMHRVLDINLVSKIEYAEFKTVADMYLYEIYYINLLKPTFNIDDRAPDEVTVTLPDVPFLPYECPLFDRWKDEINLNTSEWEQLHTEYREIPLKISLLRKSKCENELSEDEFWIKYDALKQREQELYKQLYGKEKI